MQRYPVVGGAAAWRLPVLTAMLALAGLALDAWALAAAVVALGWVGHGLWRSVVIEVSPDGLARGFALESGFVGTTVAIPWSRVTAVETAWWGPDDHRALETAIRGRDGTTIRFSTAMGLRTYWACLAEVVQRAPDAARSGLTDATLAGGPPAGRDVVAAAKTAGALALILGAMIAVCYVWAQGRSSLSRYLEEGAGSASLQPPGCRPSARILDGAPEPACPPGGAGTRLRR